MKFKHPKTLDHAISLAVEFESSEGSQNTLSKPHTVNVVLKVDKPHPNLDCVQNNTLEIIQKQIVEGFKNLSEALHTKQNNGEQTEKRVLKCNYCGKPGHILKHCRSKIRDESKKILINSVIGDFLVDSGSPVILISYKYLKSLGDRKPDLRSVETTLKSAGGNSLEVIGKS